MPMLKPDDQRFIREVFRFWGGLSSADQERVLSQTMVRTYPGGYIVKSANEECGGLLLLKSGQLRAFFEGEGGKEITLYRLLPMDLCILSAPCIIKSITFDVTLEAEKESTILQIPPTLWGELALAYTAVQNYSMELVASRFSDVMWILDQIISRNLGQRVSAFLLEQSVLESADELHITHDMIARNLGTAREVVSRVLKYLEGEGAITQARGMIRIIRPEKLLL